MFPSIVNNVLRSTGQPLDPPARAWMEPRFGHDFSRVRIHTDDRSAESARAVNAQAYTVGQDVIFGAGNYAPATGAGRRLLAHELAHVIQQGGAMPPMRHTSTCNERERWCKCTAGTRPAVQQGGVELTVQPKQVRGSTTLEIDDSQEQAAEGASAAIEAENPRIVPGRTSSRRLARKINEYTDSKKQVLEELNRDMPVAVLGMLDSMDQKTRTKLNADPDIDKAMAKLPPGARTLIRKHLTAVQPADLIEDPATSSQPNAMGRPAFENLMRNRYRVKDIHTGTFPEQQIYDMKESDWHAWHPGASSPAYSSIVEAFQNFEKTFGGIPPVDKIIFYEAEYKVEATPGHAEKKTDTGASYSKGILTIYKAVTTSNVLRLGENEFKQPAGAEAVHGNITHELGHGITEIALDQKGSGPAGQDPQMMEDYQLAVGWTATSPQQLYDIQAPGVENALGHGLVPPADALITKNTWVSAKLKERPLTVYMLISPGEDFAEAIMAYINQPEALKTLSPARYKFIDERKAKWGPAAKQHMNVWEAAKKGGQPRTLLPAEKPNIWEAAKAGKD
jgi:hypothetical protein